MSGTQEEQAKQTRPASVAEEEAQSRITAREALIAANRFLLKTMRDRFTAGLPKQVIFSTRSVWIVPILLTYPQTGVLGEVGMIAVDDQRGTIVGWTPVEEVERLGKELYEEKKGEIEPAFSLLMP